MKIMTVEASDEQSAQVKLAEQLGIGIADLKFLKAQQKKFSFEVANCPATLDVEITRDGMKALIRRLSLPIGDRAPKLTSEFVIQQLGKYGVKVGIKRDVVEELVVKMTKTPGYDDSVQLNLVVAEGVQPIAGSTGRPKWAIDLKVFEKNIPIFVKKGEVLARVPHATPPKDGTKVTGETVPATIEEQFKLNTGAGIKVVREPTELLYVPQSFGRLHYDQGIRLRLEAKVTELDEGMTAAIETGKQTISGQAITAEDLLEMAKDQRVTFGFLPAETIELQLKTEKKWPALIRVAKGQLPVDGAHGEVKFTYKQAASAKAVDVLKAKLGIVFPGETIAIISPPKEPVPGQTVFGELLRGKARDDMPIYPGKNVSRERVETDSILKASIYGRVKADKDRLGVENILLVSADKMEVILDLFPQVCLSHQDILNLLREADILLQPNKEEIERELKTAFENAERLEKFPIVKGKPPQVGTDAKIVYRFSPEIFKEKGLFAKKTETVLFALPGDLLMTKILPVEAQAGVNVYREKIPVPEGGEPKDVEVKVGDGVDEKEIGTEGDPKDPLRLEYRSAVIGVVNWKNRSLSVRSMLEISKDEKLVEISLASRSDFGTPATEDLLKKVAEAEAIRVDLEIAEIRKALAHKRTADGTLMKVTFAKNLEPKHGADATIDYLVEYNEKPIGAYLMQRSGAALTPVFLDCVRPRDILATKTPPTSGEDGKSVFGRRIAADRGKDEFWQIGFGVDKSPDGNQIFCASKAPGFVFVEDGKIVVRSTVKIANDKMSATVSLYPSKNPKFPLREDKVLAMLDEARVKYGIKKTVIKQAIEQVIATGTPVLDLVVAEGLKPTKGQDASVVLAVDVGNTVGEERADGSMDFKNRNIFLSVTKGQLLLIRRPSTPGEEGRNVLNEVVPSLFGSGVHFEAREGVEVTGSGLEYRAMIDGILEIKDRVVRVIGGLLVPNDVSFKTGHIEAGTSDLFVRGSVLPDFKVHSEGNIHIDKAAEASTVLGGANVTIRGGVIGRNRGYVHCAKDMETVYISGGATVEVLGNLTVGTEVLNSNVRVVGQLECMGGAGTICGGEIWVFGGMKVKTIGAPGSETQTIIHMGAHYFEQKAAEDRIRDEGLNEKIAELETRIKELSREISDGFADAQGQDLKGVDLQEKCREKIEEKQKLQRELEIHQANRQVILNQVSRNPKMVLAATDMIYPGVTIIYGEITWVLKEPQRGVEVRWNSATSNLISKRL